MKKLLLGLGLLAVSRLLARRQPVGFARFTSLKSVAAMVAGAAAAEMMNRSGNTPKRAQAHAMEPGNNRNKSFWRRFSHQPTTGEAT